MVAPKAERRAPRWLLLIHQLPPKPAYLRVKIGRHLARIGAVAIKNSVYALPATEHAREDVAWVRSEIVEGGGEACACEASFVEGLSDEDVEGLFLAARDADYEALAEEVRAARKRLPPRGAVPDERRAALGADVARFQRRLAELAAIDFFGAPARETVSGLLVGLGERLSEARGGRRETAAARRRSDEVRGRTWVTRKGIQVDRIASAWLVRRFIDPQARFKFVGGKGYAPEAGELRFDMFDAEFTHEGDRCTFEVLVRRFGLNDAALRAIGELVHDIDLKDDKFGRPEKEGVERLLQGIASSHAEDDARLARGSSFFDDLYASFSK